MKSVVLMLAAVILATTSLFAKNKAAPESSHALPHSLCWPGFPYWDEEFGPGMKARLRNSNTPGSVSWQDDTHFTVMFENGKFLHIEALDGGLYSAWNNVGRMPQPGGPC